MPAVDSAERCDAAGHGEAPEAATQLAIPCSASSDAALGLAGSGTRDSAVGWANKSAGGEARPEGGVGGAAGDRDGDEMEHASSASSSGAAAAVE